MDIKQLIADHYGVDVDAVHAITSCDYDVVRDGSILNVIVHPNGVMLIEDIIPNDFY